MSRSKELTFTPQEKQTLDKFRPLVKNIIVHDFEKEDAYLIRWLRAHTYNLNAAANALREAQQWRKANRIDSIVNETILEFATPPYTLDGVDKKGRPVLAMSASKMDVRKLILAGKRDQLLRYLLQSGERAVVKAREGRNTTSAKDGRFISIIDLHGFSTRQHGCLACIELYADWTRKNEKYYPGVLVHDLWINTPRIALPIIEILSPLMSEESLKTFRAFGTNREEWSAFLRKIIPADQLTYQFGGTKHPKF
jgi:hypothetical protein